MPKDTHGPKLPEAEPMAFKLSDLQRNKPDPRGRMVRDVLWALDEFKIYKTDFGISPFFSDNRDLAAIQRMRYLDLDGIADFNHLIETVQPWYIPFTKSPILARGARQSSYLHYERELAGCLARALLGQADMAKSSLTALSDRLVSRICNRARVIHLFINVIVVLLLVAAA